MKVVRTGYFVTYFVTRFSKSSTVLKPALYIVVKFIKEYLRDRTQKVVIGDNSSDSLPVDSGVPQGSILGPLLFVLFINDIYTCVSNGTNIALYADDTKVWRKIASEIDCILLNNDINSLNKWALRNKMWFHPSKCKIVTFF